MQHVPLMLAGLLPVPAALRIVAVAVCCTLPLFRQATTCHEVRNPCVLFRRPLLTLCPTLLLLLLQCPKVQHKQRNG